MTAPTLRLALAQMTSADTHAANIASLDAAAAKAARDGADMLALPEVAGLMKRRIDPASDGVGPAAADPFLAACQRIAAAHRLWIHCGSTPVTGPADGRFLNHSALVNGDGAIVARYDKIHLFDMFPANAPPIRESRRYAPGDTGVLAPTPWGCIGMSICYDLRFPHLYRAYAQGGAVLMMIPSAFTVPTGQAHWEVLLRARAIETGAYVVAAAQIGEHEGGRRTYGHSMVVDPWGAVLLDMGGTDTGVAVVDLDMGAVASARARIPSLTHDRPYA